MTTTVEIEYVSGNALHRRYKSQTTAQPCYVQLDPRTGELSADWDSTIGSGGPEAVAHGRLRRWSIPALKGPAANALLDELESLAQRVCDGYSEERDRQGNRRGILDEDAEEASEEIRRLCDACDESDGVHAWDAVDWFGALGSSEQQARELGITAEMSNEALAARAAELEEEAEASGECDALEGCQRYLEQLRDAARAEAA